MATVPEIRIENKGRRVFSFPYATIVGKDKKPKFTGQLVIGDSDDFHEAIPGKRDEVLQPHPVVEITKEQWEALGPEAHGVIRYYASLGELQIPRGGEIVLG
jgi:hypothetical protein